MNEILNFTLLIPKTCNINKNLIILKQWNLAVLIATPAFPPIPPGFSEEQLWPQQEPLEPPVQLLLWLCHSWILLMAMLMALVHFSLQKVGIPSSDLKGFRPHQLTVRESTVLHPSPSSWTAWGGGTWVSNHSSTLLPLPDTPLITHAWSEIWHCDWKWSTALSTTSTW